MRELKTDVLVIGSEAAGAKAAIEAQDAGVDVLVVTKGSAGKSGNTVMAGRGVQAAIGHMDPRDNPSVFMQDVVKGGGYLNNQKLVERLVELSVTEVPKMERWGARFMKRGEKFVQVQLPGSSYPRSLTPVSYHGGLQWRAAFRSQFRARKTKVLEDLFITRLLRSGDEVAGAVGVCGRTGKLVVIRSKQTILATGGCTQVYEKTDGSIHATGDGMALAYEAGAELADMEFQQFFPMCCYTPPFEMSLITANLRYGLHARFYNRWGEAFMERYAPTAKEWGLRDLTARAIYLEDKLGRGSPHGGAYLAVNHLPENLIEDWIERERPAYIPKLQELGIDIRKHALECGPASHYSMGGVRVDENCRTGLKRFYAAGEVASGMDGAERIDGGPAITWCLTMGHITGVRAAAEARTVDWVEADPGQIAQEQGKIDSLMARRSGVKGFEVKRAVKEIMWRNGALVRDRAGLEQGLKAVESIRDEKLPRLCVPDPSPLFNKGLIEALESANMVTVSEMILRAALMREESRGAHFRSDFEKTDDKNWCKNIVIRKTGAGMACGPEAVVVTRIRPPEDRELGA